MTNCQQLPLQGQSLRTSGVKNTMPREEEKGATGRIAKTVLISAGGQESQ